MGPRTGPFCVVRIIPLGLQEIGQKSRIRSIRPTWVHHGSIWVHDHSCAPFFHFRAVPAKSAALEPKEDNFLLSPDVSRLERMV
jgi:hypothetical protein